MKNSENGQAMIELSLMLLLMTFATLGMLMVCSMADFTDEAYMQSRFNAEIASRSGKECAAGDEFSTWQSSISNSPYSGMNIPFNVNEKPVVGINPVGSFGGNFNDAEYSVPVMSGPYDNYKKLNKYHRLADFDGNTFKHDFYDSSLEENMFNAANLVHGRPDDTGDNPIARIISRSGYRKGAKLSSSPDKSYNGLLKAFTKLFGVDLEDAGRKIKDSPGTAAFMPVTENITE